MEPERALVSADALEATAPITATSYAFAHLRSRGAIR